MTQLIAGKYEVLETIGRGGMGTVYKALQRNLDRVVAVKMLSEELAADPEFRARFQQEATIIARLNHPNIVAVHDIEPHNHTFCIIMEYLEGETLQAKIDRDVSLAEREALSVSAQVARALHYAHAHGIIHRDIKPDNIHISPTGAAKVMDFGIARFLQSKLKTQTGISMGTPKFMSPEQVTGKNMDGQTDLYSLGICLYVALCGRVPFDGENAITIATRHLYEPPEPPSRINPAITPAAEKIVLRALEKAKGDRFKDGTDMANAIEAVLQARSPVRLGDETGREVYSGATQKVVSVSGAAGSIQGRAGGHDSTSPKGGTAVAVSTPTGIHRLGDVVNREHEAAREQVRASTISTTNVPLLDDDDFPAVADEEVGDETTPRRGFSGLSRRLWPTIVALLLMISAGAYFVVGDQGDQPGAILPGGVLPKPTVEAEFQAVLERAQSEAQAGRATAALEAIKSFKAAHSSFNSGQVDELLSRYTAALPLTDTTKKDLQEYRVERAGELIKTPEWSKVGVAYVESAKELGELTGAGKFMLNNVRHVQAKDGDVQDQLAAAQKARAAKDAEAERKALMSAANLDPENPQRWTELGDFFETQGYRDDARVMYTRALHLTEGPERDALERQLEEWKGAKRVL